MTGGSVSKKLSLSLDRKIKQSNRRNDRGVRVTVQNQVYRCNVCGNIVEVLHSGVGTLVCCGQPMELLEEKTKGKGEGNTSR